MFKRASGLHYHRFLRRLHSAHLFDWYLEIGCRTGESLAPVRSKTIGVDPFFRAEINIIGKKPALHIAQQTSDDFFASGFLANNRIKLSTSFLDGMHLFEFLLRDFINTEAQSDAEGVIMLHDCVPFSYEMTTRDLANLPQRAWTGDVWKLIPILQAYRPDLTLTVLDCRPTGLVCVTGLSPGNKVLADNYENIIRQYQDVTLEAFGAERFFDSFELASALECEQAGFPQWKAASIDPSLAIQPQLVST
ncbi:hypothetical protein [Tabrizicola sp. BL-A-41-H6]|uniref:hypothetical protein n=1 Tax=Tabrizicola sp. BL-A-41-H6 TaxID=3421107 RepID=UPI003D66BDC9